jgi:phospholipid/cholesterol/gamma-HCH transport system substrate-binding protein
VLPDDADIPLERTQTPIELDRMYKALNDLSVTLGPKEGTTGGALDNLLTAGTKALEGNGELGSKTIRNLSEAADTFARNRGPLFDNVRSLAHITDTLAANDKTVEAFLESLTSVSGQLEGERDELRQMLKSLARVLGTVKGFVHDNRKALGKDIELLSSVLARVDKEKDNLGLVVQKGSSAMSNLAVAFESSTGTYGSRVQVAPGIQFRPDQFVGELCRTRGGPDAVCTVLEDLLGSLLVPDASTSAAGAEAPETTGAPSAPTAPELVPTDPNKLPSLLSLLGGDR